MYVALRAPVLTRFSCDTDGQHRCQDGRDSRTDGRVCARERLSGCGGRAREEAQAQAQSRQCSLVPHWPPQSCSSALSMAALIERSVPVLLPGLRRGRHGAGHHTGISLQPLGPGMPLRRSVSLRMQRGRASVHLSSVLGRSGTPCVVLGALCSTPLFQYPGHSRGQMSVCVVYCLHRTDGDVCAVPSPPHRPSGVRVCIGCIASPISGMT